VDWADLVDDLKGTGTAGLALPIGVFSADVKEALILGQISRINHHIRANSWLDDRHYVEQSLNKRR